MPASFLVPVLLLQVPAAAIPDGMEVFPGVFLLKSQPTADTYAALKKAGISHVVNLRRDGEPGFDAAAEAAELQAIGVAYLRIPMGRTPTSGDLDQFRKVLGGLPPEARVLLHCASGNRASGALCAWLALDKGRKLEDAMAASKQAGLANTETETAIRKYIESKVKP